MTTITIRPTTLESELTVTLKADSNGKILNRMYFNKNLVSILRKKKLTDMLRYADINFYNNQLTVILSNDSNNRFSINRTNDNSYNIAFTQLSTYNTVSKKLSVKLTKELSEIIINQPDTIIFKLISIKANVLFFEVSGISYAVIPNNPANAMSKALNDLLTNTNLIKEIITSDRTFE